MSTADTTPNPLTLPHDLSRWHPSRIRMVVRPLVHLREPNVTAAERTLLATVDQLLRKLDEAEHRRPSSSDLMRAIARGRF